MALGKLTEVTKHLYTQKRVERNLLLSFYLQAIAKWIKWVAIKISVCSSSHTVVRHGWNLQIPKKRRKSIVIL